MENLLGQFVEGVGVLGSLAPCIFPCLCCSSVFNDHHFQPDLSVKTVETVGTVGALL